MKKFFIFVFIFCLIASVAYAQKSVSLKTKFYNFDDLLIQGEYKRPQILYTDSKKKVKFSRLLKLKKDFLGNLKNTKKDRSLR